MRRSSLVRRVAAASVALLALSGCAWSESEPQATEPTVSDTPAESPTPTESAEGEEIEPSAFIADVLGALEDATTAHVTIEMHGGPATIEAQGDIDYATSPPSMALTMNNKLLGPGKSEIRMVDGVLYVGMDARSVAQWVKIPLEGKDLPLGANLVEQLDPGAGLRFVEDAVTSVTLVGDEDVDGETLEHYTMEVRTDTARRLQEQFGGNADLDLPSVVTFDVWTDYAGLMRRSEMSMGDVGSVTTTMSDWGEPVDIVAPPEDEVIDYGR